VVEPAEDVCSASVVVGEDEGAEVSKLESEVGELAAEVGTPTAVVGQEVCKMTELAAEIALYVEGYSDTWMVRVSGRGPYLDSADADSSARETPPSYDGFDFKGAWARLHATLRASKMSPTMACCG
jgi:hypothetical protein